MKRQFFTIFALILGAFALSSYAQPALAGRDWRPTFLRGTVVSNTKAFIRFTEDERRFSGNAGCNIMNGPVRMRGRSIDFGPVITTKIACTPKPAAIEGALLSALERSNRFQITRNRFRLYDGRRLLAEFSPVRQIEPDEEPSYVPDRLNLEDRRWVLKSIAGSVIPKVEQEAFVVFDPVKNSAGGDTSCNVFGGSYSAEGNKLRITETISTMRACIEDQRMDIERGFLDGLRNADRYEIRTDELMLYRRSKLLLTFQGQKKR